MTCFWVENARLWSTIRRMSGPDHQPPPRWKNCHLIVKKFIDDVNAPEKCDITGARSVFSTKNKQCFVHACECEHFLNAITRNTESWYES